MVHVLRVKHCKPRFFYSSWNFARSHVSIFHFHITLFKQILEPECQCKESVSEGKKGKEYLCIERKVAHSVIKARLQHSFDGHRARDTSIFLHILSLQHFNFLLFSDPMLPFSYHSFQTDPKVEIAENSRPMPEVSEFSKNSRKKCTC